MSIHFTTDHEWIAVDGTTGTVGISNYAQEQLGDVVFVELPAIGAQLSKGDEAAVVESVKAAGEVYAPVGGEVTVVNDALADEPGRINSDALGEGWLFKLTLADAGELGGLMDDAAYEEYVKGLE